MILDIDLIKKKDRKIKWSKNGDFWSI